MRRSERVRYDIDSANVPKVGSGSDSVNVPKVGSGSDSVNAEGSEEGKRVHGRFV